jgi:hypothetical protein
MAIYARCKSDVDTAWWKYKPRSTHKNWKERDKNGNWYIPPATVSLSRSASKHTKDRFRIPKPWLEFVQHINGGRKAKPYKAMMRKFGGWNNEGTFNSPKIESLSWWGSTLELTGVSGRYALIKTFDFRSSPPNPKAYNYGSHPELIHQFTAISKTGKMYLLGRGYRAYSILISRGPLYVPLDRIELFPELPRVERITIGRLNIRANPTLRAKRVGQYKRGEEVRIVEYALRGPSVWGKTDRGWIAIGLASDRRKFTTWGMKTIPAK